MKYDCTKAKDFLHELTRLTVACNKVKSPFPCGGCPLAVYDLEFLCLGKTTFASGIFSDISENKFNDIVKRLQEWSDTHPERRELTEDEVTILKAMAIMGNKYIVKDKNGKVYVFPEKPHKSGGIWLRKPGSSYETQITSDSLFSDILSFDDEEPAEIEELLKCARK